MGPEAGSQRALLYCTLLCADPALRHMDGRAGLARCFGMQYAAVQRSWMMAVAASMHIAAGIQRTRVTY